MSYVEPNFKTKKALRDALSAGDRIRVFQPGLGSVPQDGIVFLEGPHYPEPHRWYAKGVMRGGVLVSVK